MDINFKESQNSAILLRYSIVDDAAVDNCHCSCNVDT